MNVLDAAHRIGLEFPGGISGLALRIGRDPAILRSKLNPNSSTNHVSLAEAVLIQSVAGRVDILQAMAEELRHVAIPLPDGRDENLPHALATTCAEFGDYLRRVDAVFEDGTVTPNEIKRLEKELTEMIAAASALHAVIVGMSKRV